MKKCRKLFSATIFICFSFPAHYVYAQDELILIGSNANENTTPAQTMRFVVVRSGRPIDQYREVT
jgi:hypothetical protein